MSLTTPTRRIARVVAAAAVVAALAASSVAWAGQSQHKAGGTVTLALPPGTTWLTASVDRSMRRRVVMGGRCPPGSTDRVRKA